MGRRRQGRGRPLDLGQVLLRLAREAGQERLRKAALAAALAEALGPHLARRVAGIHADGRTWRVEMVDAATGREVQRHASGLLAVLRTQIGGDAPARLEVVVIGGRAAAGPAERPARVEQPVLELASHALAGIEDPEARQRLARWITFSGSAADDPGHSGAG